MAPVAKRLEGKVAIITGGAGAIGATTAKLFLQHGAKVIIADVQDELGISLCKSLITKDGAANNNNNIDYVHCDVTSEQDVKNAVDLAVSKYGHLDIMYNNAGTAGDNIKRPMENSTVEDFKRIFDVNVLGAFLGAKHAARVMVKAQRGGVILFTTSITSVIGGQAKPAYSASKHALVGLMKDLCVELGQHGIRANCIAPGGIATPMLNGWLKMEREGTEEILQSVGVLKGGVVKEEDVAEAAVYLSSDEGRFISGVNLVVDGGYSSTNGSFAMIANVLKNIQTTNCIDA
ncbi:momilactone A synthase [Arachis duranensis]|uniref:Momilactone A synthase n=1 Tax=Arachis duranensis TaxID=130453 RepID=A0A6P4DM85_ARADU|nr:momilactone A synthase [Arachis duranensis]